MREVATDSLRYWEKGRLVYNAVLLMVTMIGLLVLSPLTGVTMHARLLALLTLFAIAANLLYCAAYPIDLLVQLSDYRETWRRQRILLFGAGTLFAICLAVPVVVVLCAGVPMD